jgi:hypothetical protein
MTTKFVMLVCLLLLMPVADRADAVVSDPAASQVLALTASLLQSMQAGPSERMTERYRRLEPVISQVIGLPLMTRLAVGPVSRLVQECSLDRQITSHASIASRGELWLSDRPSSRVARGSLSARQAHKFYAVASHWQPRRAQRLVAVPPRSANATPMTIAASEEFIGVDDHGRAQIQIVRCISHSKHRRSLGA